MKKYYAVKVGRKTGIYDDYILASEQVKGYKNGQMKSFKDLDKAADYLNDLNYYVVVKGRTIGIFRSEQYFNRQVCDIFDTEYQIFKDGMAAIKYFSEHIQAKKYYVIKNGKEIGIFIDEKVYLEHTKGYKGAVCKSYKTLGNAMLFLTSNEMKRAKIEPPVISKNKTIDTNECVAYVDGSFDHKENIYSLGIVLFYDGKQIEIQQAMKDPNWLKYGNVAGEVFAARTAVQEAKKRGAKSIKIYHDFNGLSECLDENVKTTATIWKTYKKSMKKLKKDIDFEFEHVKAHSGIKYNNLADRLARAAIKNKQTKLKMREVCYAQ